MECFLFVVVVVVVFFFSEIYNSAGQTSLVQVQWRPCFGSVYIWEIFESFFSKLCNLKTGIAKIGRENPFSRSSDYLVTKERNLTLMALKLCFEDLSFDGIESPTHHNFLR